VKMYNPDSIESFERILLWRRIGILAKKASPVIALLPLAAGILVVTNYGPLFSSRSADQRTALSNPENISPVSYRQVGPWRVRDDQFRQVGPWRVRVVSGS
jgi:hypothetical protein